MKTSCLSEGIWGKWKDGSCEEWSPELLSWATGALITERQPPAKNLCVLAIQVTTGQPFTFNQPFNRFLFCITTTNLQYKKRGIIRLLFALFYSQTQHTRRIFEDLIAKQTQEALRDSPIVRRQRRNSNKKAYLQKEKPHSKPDSVFQKLIDRFDPMRLTSGAKTRVKSWCTCRARVSQRYCFYHCIIALGVACFYACADWIILWTICDVIPGAGCGATKPRLSFDLGHTPSAELWSLLCECWYLF